MKTLLCAIAKCENRYIMEWITWHLKLGFDKIVVYDNNNSDGERIKDVVGDLQGAQIIEWIDKKQTICETQVSAYNDCYTNNMDVDWIMYLDIDEFLELNGFGSVQEYLSQDWIKDTDIIKFHWKCYSDNGRLYAPAGLVTENFTELCSDRNVNIYTKSIYRGGLKNLKMTNVHFCNGTERCHYQNGSPCKVIRMTTDKNINYDCGWVRHYVTKSVEEFVNIKYARRNPGISKSRLNNSFYFKYNKYTKEKDELFRRLVDELERKQKQNIQQKQISNTNTYRPMNNEPAWCRMIPPKKQVPSIYELEHPNANKKQQVNEQKQSEYPFGVSVCISAWKTAEYIEECLDSVAAQTWFKDHDNWEILLGIDGCEETLAKVKEIMHKYKNLKVMMMDKNVGTYVTCNTIMKEARYEWLLRFDSDDVMYPNMVDKLMTFRKPIQPCFVQYQYCDFVGNFQNKRNSSINARGSVFYSKSIFEKYGGYKNWRCAADFEMLERLKNFVSYYAINKPLFYRRKHNNNLTNNADTGMKSEYRIQLHKQIYSPLNENDAIIICETQTYKKITISPLVSFLIVNRGGTELKKVIDNINNSFNCEKEIIIINQEDTDFFKRGQLFNIGYKHSSGEYLVLMDNDIIILHPFDIVKKYNEINKAYLPFTKVSQLTYKTDTNYIITKTELRPSGFGAFAVVKKNDFIKSNGFSNLCMNWGAEDNIFNIKIGGFYRIDDNIGHITHPSRSTSITEKHRSINHEAYVLYNNKKIKNDYDGYQQTTFDLVYDKIEDGVRYLGVKNISVINNYTYKEILQKHYE